MEPTKRLEAIKQVNSKAKGNRSEAENKVTSDELVEWVREGHTDWLIEQAEIVEVIRRIIKDKWSTETISVNDLRKILNKQIT